MSGLIGSIINNTKALNAHSAGISTAGKNLANVNNDAYARQQVVLGDRGTIMTTSGAQSMGVEVLGVTNARDSILDNQITREKMTQGYLESQNKVASWLESVLGETVDRSNIEGSTTGLSYSIDDFFNAFQSLSANPSDDAEKRAVIDAAQVLIDQFNNMDSRLSQIDSDIADEIDAQAQKVNTLLQEVANLNREIARVEIRSPGGALDLRDSRQAKLEELAEYMNFTTQPDPDGLGQIQIVVRDTTAANVVLVDGPNVNSTVSYTGSTFTTGTPPVTIAMTSGTLAGLQNSRGGVLADLRTSLDDLANQFIDSVNASYGANFFRFDNLNPTFYRGAGGIQLDPALSLATLQTGTSGAAGANDIALAIANLADVTYTTTDHIEGTFAGYYNQLITDVGQEVATTAQQIENSDLVSAMLSEQRASVSGVSTDEEMTDLIRFQRAYQGTARVINVMDRMLEIVVSGLGAF